MKLYNFTTNLIKDDTFLPQIAKQIKLILYLT